MDRISQGYLATVSKLLWCCYKIAHSDTRPSLNTNANDNRDHLGDLDLWQLIFIHFCLLFPSSLLRYGGNLSLQSAMSVRFNSNGTQLLALRRRLPPVLYDIHSRLPVFQFDNQGYFNSCTMKSCCFAGDRDQVRSTNS